MAPTDFSKSPAIFGHRGASDYAPENTLAAFDLAARQGADGIELDVQMCADGHVVVMHDDSVDRTTDGSGKVKQMSLAALKQLDAGSYFDIAFKGERIPTLSEVFEAVGKRVLINIELKFEGKLWTNLPAEVAELVMHHNMEQKVLFSSFNPIALIQIKRLLPQIPCGLLAMEGKKGTLACKWGYRWIGCEALHPEVSSVNPKMVKRLHREGKRINVYTPNTVNEISNLIILGVDGLITNDPPLAIRLVNEWRQNHPDSSNTINLRSI